MDGTELRAMQAPIKERYKSDPGAAITNLREPKAVVLLRDKADRERRGSRERMDEFCGAVSRTIVCDDHFKSPVDLLL